VEFSSAPTLAGRAVARGIHPAKSEAKIRIERKKYSLCMVFTSDFTICTPQKLERFQVENKTWEEANYYGFV
jgi:hypothetical protein